MADFQLLSATINIGASRDHTVVRGPDDPITYPEMLILQAVHGGIEHVHSVVSVGKADREMSAERERLTQTYGIAFVQSVFPGITTPLPLSDDTIPTIEEHNAVLKAVGEVRTKVRASKAKATSVPEPAPVPAAAPAVPDLTGSKK